MRIILHNERETAALAARVAAALRPGDVLTCEGEMGTGKTTFLAAMIRAWAGRPEMNVTSPTFTLVQQYERGGVILWHYDLFRLKDARELEELGLDQAAEGITCIEWPSIACAWIPANSLALRFAYGQNERERRLEVGLPPHEARWSEVFGHESRGEG